MKEEQNNTVKVDTDQTNTAAADKTAGTGLGTEKKAVGLNGGQVRRPVKSRRRNRTGLMIFIAAGLIGIVAACAWILNNQGAAQAEETGIADADIISQGAESVVVPEVDVRQNESGNYHVISYRGYPSRAEENSIEGYDLALEAGTMYIGVDTVTSADGTLYVSDDDSPYRMTGKDGYYSDMTDAEIDALETRGGAKILKLSDVFEKYGPSVGYVVGLKDDKDATINAFCELIDKYGLQDDVMLSSFDLDVLDTVEQKYPDMTKMAMCISTGERSAALGLECADVIAVRKDLMNEFCATTIHNNGRKFAVWTLDNSQHIHDAIDLGADYYFTDETELALEIEKEYRHE